MVCLATRVQWIPTFAGVTIGAENYVVVGKDEATEITTPSLTARGDGLVLTPANEGDDLKTHYQGTEFLCEGPGYSSRALASFSKVESMLRAERRANT